MSLRQLRRSAALIVMGATLHLPGWTADATPTAFVGHSIDEAKASEFFQFFHLEKTLQQPDAAHPGMVMTWFGTTGPFKGDVTLILVTPEGGDTVKVAALMVRRDFIEGGRTAVFARDIVKSFIERTNAGASPEAKALHDALWRCLSGTEAPCDQAAPAWLTYFGKQDKQRIAFTGGYLMLQNTPVMQVSMLFVENGTD
jgi:hypothetical protein